MRALTTNIIMRTAIRPRNSLQYKERNGLSRNESNLQEADFFTKAINLIDFAVVSILGYGSFSRVYLVKKKDNGNHYAHI